MWRLLNVASRTDAFNTLQHWDSRSKIESSTLLYEVRRVIEDIAIRRIRECRSPRFERGARQEHSGLQNVYDIREISKMKEIIGPGALRRRKPGLGAQLIEEPDDLRIQ